MALRIFRMRESLLFAWSDHELLIKELLTVGGWSHQLRWNVLRRISEVVLNGFDWRGNAIGWVSPRLQQGLGAALWVEGAAWMVLHCLDLGVLDVGPVLANGLVVAGVRGVPVLEGAILRGELRGGRFSREDSVSAVCEIGWIEGTVLLDRRSVGPVRFNDQTAPHEVVLLNQILLVLVYVLCVGDYLLESFAGETVQESLEVLRLLPLWLSVVQMLKLWSPHKLIAARGPENRGMRDGAANLRSASLEDVIAVGFSQEILSGVHELISDCVWFKLPFKSILATFRGVVDYSLQLSTFVVLTPPFLVKLWGVSDSQWQRLWKQAESLPKRS